MARYGSKELAQSFRTVRTNTLEAAREIPEDRYALRAVEGCRSVAELLTHIAMTYRFQHQVHAVEKRTTMEGFDFFAFMGEVGAEEAKARTKDEIIALLEEHGEVWAGFLDGLTDEVLEEDVAFPAAFAQPPKSRFEMIMSVKEHEMHHRGQLMLTERILGIVPHLTRARQNR